MPARKVKNDNKEKQLMEKMESIKDKKEGTIEQINIEEEPDEHKRPK
ncbi:MAG: hypothetical protein ACPK85_15450 [Methanosarcina sp.]